MDQEESIELSFSGLNISSDVRSRSQPTSSRSNAAASDEGSPLSVLPAMGNNGPFGAQGKLDVMSSPRLLLHDYSIPCSWNNRVRRVSSLEDMRGGILWLAKDQVLSGMLGVSLSGEEVDMVLLELMGNWGDLLRNQYGSQFFKRLLEVCNEEQRARIIIDLVKFPYNLLMICLHPFGGRAIQKLLEKLNTPQEISLVVASLTHAALALATNPNSHNLLQYCVLRFPGEYTQHLLYKIADNCYRIATTKSGCCVLQICVENSHGAARLQLIRAIIAHALHLSEDQYGNYVVQHLIGLKISEVAQCLVKKFEGYFASLSCNKYASNVVEKMLKLGEMNVSAAILMELLRSPTAKMLLLDPFGNFVIQSALSVSKGEMFGLLLNFIKVNEVSMQSNPYGRKILCWLRRRRFYISKMVQHF